MRRLVLFAVGCWALAGPLRAQSSLGTTGHPQSEAAFLEPDKPIERTLQGGEKHIYAIRAGAGHFIHAIVDQRGIDVALTLYAPDDKTVGAMDSPNGTFGLEQISTIAETPGVYRLEVASGDKSVPAGRYQVALERIRAPGVQERARIAAERVFFEAGQLYEQGSADSLKNAIQHYLASLPLWRTAGDRYEEALTQDALGIVYSALGDNRKALDYYNQALPIWRAAGDRSGEAETLNYMGIVYSALGDNRKALDYYNQALPIWRAAGNRSGEAETLNYMGAVYSALGEKQKALDYYNQALPIWRVVGFRTGEATTLNNIGVVYDDLGQMQKALDYYHQVLPILRAQGYRNGEATVLNNIGIIYDTLGEPKTALDYYNQALPIWRVVGSPDGEALVLKNIGTAYGDLGQKQRALDYYSQALPIWHAAGNRNAEAATLLGIGNVCADSGEMQKALDYYNQALPLWRTAGDREGEATTLRHLGSVYSALGEKQKALDYYTQSLPLFRAVQDPLGEGATFVLMMEYWKSLQKPSLAVLFGKQGIDRFQQLRRNIGGLDKEARRSFLKSKEDYYRELAELLISEGRLPEAQQVLDLLKAEEYSGFTQRRGAEDSDSVARTPAEDKSDKEYDRIADEIAAIGDEWTQLDRKPARSTDEENRYNELSGRLTAANQRFQAFLKNLYSSFGKGDHANASVETIDERTAGLQTLAGELGSGTVAVYAAVFDDKCVMIVITPATRVAREVPVGRIALSGKVFAFARALARHASKEDILPKAQDLYNVLIAPIEKDLQGAHAKTLVWSLQDVLRYVPLAALYDGKQYLVERYRNVVITMASGNLKDQAQVSSMSGVAMGVSKDYDGLGELKAVPDELASVVSSDKTPGSHGPVPGMILLDDSFTETGMKTALHQHPPLVHIASHYVFSVGDDTKSYLLLGGKDTGGQGFHLTLAELSVDPRMDFRGIELLTLSGCQTAADSKDSDGREIDGLGITAQKKGAKAVVATLWAVDDASVGLLMATFYKLWITTPGISKAEALQQAQLALLHGIPDPAETPQASTGGSAAGASKQRPASQYANPFFWAPFILIGNWK